MRSKYTRWSEEAGGAAAGSRAAPGVAELLAGSQMAIALRGSGEVDASPGDGVVVVLERLRARRGRLVDTIHARVQELVPVVAGADDATYQAGLGAAIGAVVDYRLRAIEQGADGVGPVPEQALRQARLAAGVGVGLGTVLRRYVAGHRCLCELIAAEIEWAGLVDDASVLLRVNDSQELLLERIASAIEQAYGEGLAFGRAWARECGLPASRHARECLRFLASHPDASNRQIAQALGIAHKSQMSRLLAGLSAERLTVKRSEGAGKRNAWQLTAHGLEVARMLGAQGVQPNG
jgi:hypothetical protein